MKEGNIYFVEEKKNEEGKRKRRIFGKRKYLGHAGEEKREGKGGKYLETENIFLARIRRTEGEKEEKYHYKGKIVADWRTEIKGSIKCRPTKMETSIQMRSRI